MASASKFDKHCRLWHLIETGYADPPVSLHVSQTICLAGTLFGRVVGFYFVQNFGSGTEFKPEHDSAKKAQTLAPFTASTWSFTQTSKTPGVSQVKASDQRVERVRINRQKTPKVARKEENLHVQRIESQPSRKYQEPASTVVPVSSTGEILQHGTRSSFWWFCGRRKHSLQHHSKSCDILVYPTAPPVILGNKFTLATFSNDAILAIHFDDETYQVSTVQADCTCRTWSFQLKAKDSSSQISVLHWVEEPTTNLAGYWRYGSSSNVIKCFLNHKDQVLIIITTDNGLLLDMRTKQAQQCSLTVSPLYPKALGIPADIDATHILYVEHPGAPDMATGAASLDKSVILTIAALPGVPPECSPWKSSKPPVAERTPRPKENKRSLQLFPRNVRFVRHALFWGDEKVLLSTDRNEIRVYSRITQKLLMTLRSPHHSGASVIGLDASHRKCISALFSDGALIVWWGMTGRPFLKCQTRGILIDEGFPCRMISCGNNLFFTTRQGVYMLQFDARYFPSDM